MSLGCAAPSSSWFSRIAGVIAMTLYSRAYICQWPLGMGRWLENTLTLKPSSSKPACTNTVEFCCARGIVGLITRTVALGFFRSNDLLRHKEALVCWFVTNSRILVVGSWAEETAVHCTNGSLFDQQRSFYWKTNQVCTSVVRSMSSGARYFGLKSHLYH